MKAIEIVAQKKFYSSLTNQPFEIVHTFFIDEYKAKNKEAVKGMASDHPISQHSTPRSSGHSYQTQRIYPSQKQYNAQQPIRGRQK